VTSPTEKMPNCTRELVPVMPVEVGVSVVISGPPLSGLSNVSVHAFA
jgi:hypothetical protein